ncbi:MAG: glycosyltransferase [Oceanococcus sp.]
MASFLLLLTLLLSVTQFGLYSRLIRALRENSVSADAPTPRAAVILCVRGCDPSLRSCLAAALHLDYPDYQLHVILDSADDPAHNVVQAAFIDVNSDRMQIHVLQDPKESCSLKCSALVQVISGLEKTFEVIALLDADTTPHANWLRDLTAPLSDPAVGAAHGNRWFFPPVGGFGSLLRYVWNASAVSQMFNFGIPWGGSLALRRDAIEKAGLLEKWSHALAEDTLIQSAFREHGLQVRFVPQAMQANREECATFPYYRWMRRQLLVAKLYHKNWLSVFVHGMATTLIPVPALVLCVVALCMGESAIALLSGFTVAFYAGVMTVLFVATERAIRDILYARGEPTVWLRPAMILPFVAALVVAQLSYSMALLDLLRLRTVTWRAIDYRVDAPWRIRRLTYRVYDDSQDQAQLESL